MLASVVPRRECGASPSQTGCGPSEGQRRGGWLQGRQAQRDEESCLAATLPLTAASRAPPFSASCSSWPARPYGPEDVLAHFREAQKAGLAASDVIPTLFPEEPRFQDATLAKRLFQNLLGLWDVSPGNVSLALPGPRPKKERPQRPPALQGGPSHLGMGGIRLAVPRPGRSVSHPVFAFLRESTGCAGYLP